MQKKIISFLSILLINLQVFAPNELTLFKEKMDKINAKPRVLNECFIFIKNEIKARKKNLEPKDLLNIGLDEILLTNPDVLEGTIGVLNSLTTNPLSQKRILNFILHSPHWQDLVKQR